MHFFCILKIKGLNISVAAKISELLMESFMTLAFSFELIIGTLLAPSLRLCQITFTQRDSEHTLSLSPTSRMVGDMFRSLTWLQESEVHGEKVLLKEKEHTAPDRLN